MSTEQLADDDAALLEHLDQQAEENHEPNDYAGEDYVPREELEEERQRRRELEEKVDSMHGTLKDLVSTVNELQGRVDGDDPTNPRTSTHYNDRTLLEKYASMSDEEREETLGPTTQRAVEIFQNWEDWRDTTPNGQVISTKMRRGRYDRLALKVDLQNAREKELHNAEVYRAMKEVARLSVTDNDEVEAVTDTSGREHITGGAFEFHEKPNPDNSSDYKILTLANPDEVTLL